METKTHSLTQQKNPCETEAMAITLYIQIKMMRDKPSIILYKYNYCNFINI